MPVINVFDNFKWSDTTIFELYYSILNVGNI